MCNSMKASILAAGLWVMGVCGMAHGALEEVVPSDSVKTKLAPMLRNLKNTKFFAAGGGWYGIAAKSADGKDLIMYCDPTGEYFMTGMMMRVTPEEGIVNLTIQAAQQYFPKTKLGELANKYSAAEKDYIQAETDKASGKNFQFDAKKLAELPYVQQGEGATVVYGFVDPTLPSSKKAIQELTIFQQSGGRGRVAFRWLPYSGGQLQSTNTAASILGSTDPLHKLWLAASDTKPYEPDMAAVAKGAMKVEQIMQYAKSMGVRSSPFFVLFQNGAMQYRDGYKGFEWFAR